ncbi:MAG: hypothetical protein AMJ38_02230 [Dehalococcoidia bacterium DG_22]|nr:MAG: hypothetical protein AMJ38_02230 [Dehalococcoidia bacterium DG_22]
MAAMASMALAAPQGQEASCPEASLGRWGSARQGEARTEGQPAPWLAPAQSEATVLAAGEEGRGLRA